MRVNHQDLCNPKTHPPNWSNESSKVQQNSYCFCFLAELDARLCTLEQALLSVGFPISGLLTDSYETGSDITTLNTTLNTSGEPRTVGS